MTSGASSDRHDRIPLLLAGKERRKPRPGAARILSPRLREEEVAAQISSLANGGDEAASASIERDVEFPRGQE